MASRLAPLRLGLLHGLCRHSTSCRLRLRRLSTALPSLYRGSALPLGVVEAGEESLVTRSPWPEVAIPQCNLAEFVWEHSHVYGSATALVCGMSGRSYTYSAARQQATTFGSALLRQGAARGDVLCLVLPNIPEFPIAFLGAVGAGLTVTTIKSTNRPEDVARLLENCQARFVVTDSSSLAGVQQAYGAYGGQERIIVVGPGTPQDCVSFTDMVAEGGDDTLYTEQLAATDVHSDVAVMPYSSGTSGPQKGVCLSHFNMVANTVQALAPGVAPRLSSMLEGQEQEVVLAVLPFSHIYSMALFMLAQLRLGHKLVTLPSFEPSMYLLALSTFRPTVLQSVPPIVSFLATSRTVKSSHLESVKVMIGGAAHFSPAVLQQLMDKTGGRLEFREGYGLTETCSLALSQPGEGAVLGSCGCPVPNTLAKLVDPETGELVGPGQRGELCVSGPQVMLGYHRNSRATKRAVIEHWLHTGDIATYDSVTGQFTIVDRLKEMVKVKDMLVSPSELEDVVRQHPGVSDVAVVGAPDEMTGERPRAYIVRRNTNVLEQSVMDWVEERVESHKKLGTVVFVESLPQNSVGKMLRRELKAQVFKGSFGGF